MDISVSVMMHPSREKYREYLSKKLGDPPIIMDRGLGLWDTARRAWLAYDKDNIGGYHVVIQDDAIVCDSFIRLAGKCIKSKEYAYSFYYGNRSNLRKEVEDGKKKGHIISNWLNWGVAICLPNNIIDEMIEYCDKLNIKNDDTRIARFLSSKKIKVFYPIPSLVDHRAEEESLVGDLGKHRKAFYFIDNENK